MRRPMLAAAAAMTAAVLVTHVAIRARDAAIAGGSHRAASGKTLVYCSEASPSGFDPGQHTTGTDFDASSLTLYNQLVEFKPGTLDLEPALATRWDVSPDQKIYTFYLRRGVKFHTTPYFKPKREFDAEDVLFTFRRMLDRDDPFRRAYPATFPYFSDLGFDKNIARIDKLDNRTVRFVLRRPDVIFARNLAIDFASILSAEYASQLAREHREADINQRPIGTGPFVFRSYTKDETIRYDANPDYWRAGRVKLAHLVFAITPDASMRIEKLISGECEVAAAPRPADLDTVRRAPKLTLLSTVGFNLGFVAYNTQHPPLDRVAVRRALDMAIDKRALIESVYGGHARVATNPMPPAQWAYNETLHDAPYDPGQAKRLLRQAGFPNGFSLTLWAMPIQRPYNPNARLMAELIQSDWAKIGVKAAIVSYEWGEFNRRAKLQGQHDAILYGWGGDNGDPDNWLGTLLGCAAIHGSNLSKWCDPAFDALLDKARTNGDLAARVTLYRQAQVIFKREVPYTPIAHAVISMPMSKRVHGLVFSPLGGHRFEGVWLD